MSNKVLSGIKWAFAEQAGVQVISLLVFLLLARLLGPSAFGLIALSQAFVMFVTVTIQQGFSQAIVQRHELDDMHLHTAFWANLALSSAAFILVHIFAEQIASLFSEPELEPIIRALSCLFLITPVWTIQQAIFKRDLEFKPLALQSILGTTAGNGVALTMAFLDYGVWSLVAREIVKAAVCSYSLWRVCRWRPAFKFSLARLRELLNFASHVMGGNIVLFFGQKADSLLIGYFIGTVELGFYHVAMRIISVLNQLFSRTIEKIAMPVFSKLQTGMKELQQAYLKASRASGFVLIPIYVGVALTIAEFVPTVFGDKWDASIPIMKVLIIAGLAQSLIYLKIALLMGIGKPQVRTRIITAESVLKIILVSAAVHFGLLMTAYAVLLTTLLMYPLWVFHTNRALNISVRTYLQSYPQTLLCLVGMIAAVLLVQDFALAHTLKPAIILCLMVAVGVLAYSAAAFLFCRKFLSNLSFKL